MVQYRLGALLAACGLLAAGCSVGGAAQVAAPAPTQAPTQAPSPPAVVSPFTGLPGGIGQPVITVKIDNARPARPLTGVAEADIVYLEPVEGEVTRILAVYSSLLPETLGPVRSFRESDLMLLRQFGHPALVYSGEALDLLPALRAAPLTALSPAEVPHAFYRGGDRPRPFNLYARTAPLLAAAAGRASMPQDIGFRFGSPPPGGMPLAQQTVRYRSAVFTVEWSAGESRWLVSMDGAPLESADGRRLGAATVVVQYVSVRPSTIRDTSGAVSPIVETLGAGTALVLRDGLGFDALWSRPFADTGTTFTTPDGSTLPFAPGPVWVVLAPA